MSELEGVTWVLDQLAKAITLTEELYIVIEDTETHTYFVSDAIGDARVYLLRYKQQLEMKEQNL